MLLHNYKVAEVYLLWNLTFASTVYIRGGLFHGPGSAYDSSTPKISKYVCWSRRMFVTKMLKNSGVTWPVRMVYRATFGFTKARAPRRADDWRRPKLSQVRATVIVCCVTGRYFAVYILATFSNRRTFSERPHKTTRNATLSGTSACCVLPAAPRGLFYHDTDKAFFLGTNQGAWRAQLLCCVYYSSSSVRAWLGPPQGWPRALEALNACLLTTFICWSVFSRK